MSKRIKFLLVAATMLTTLSVNAQVEKKTFGSLPPALNRQQ